MLLSLLKEWFRRRNGRDSDRPLAPGGEPLRLHIGGQDPHPGWKILDVRPGPHVAYVAHCADLSMFGDESVAQIYASHVIEHLGFKVELPAALSEFNRVLEPGGTLLVSVPDLAVLCALFVDPGSTRDERYQVMRMMFGSQLNDADFHYVGLYEELLTSYLEEAGFGDIVRVAGFGLFADTSNTVFKGRPISLNLRARKPAPA